MLQVKSRGLCLISEAKQTANVANAQHSSGSLTAKQNILPHVLLSKPESNLSPGSRICRQPTKPPLQNEPTSSCGPLRYKTNPPPLKTTFAPLRNEPTSLARPAPGRYKTNPSPRAASPQPKRTHRLSRPPSLRYKTNPPPPHADPPAVQNEPTSSRGLLLPATKRTHLIARPRSPTTKRTQIHPKRTPIVGIPTLQILSRH